MSDDKSTCFGCSLECWGLTFVSINMVKSFIIIIVLSVIIGGVYASALHEDCFDCEFDVSKFINVIIGLFLAAELIEVLLEVLTIVGIKKTIPGMVIPWIVVACISVALAVISLLRNIFSSEKTLPGIMFLEILFVALNIFSVVVMIKLYKWLVIKKQSA